MVQTLVAVDPTLELVTPPVLLNARPPLELAALLPAGSSVQACSTKALADQLLIDAHIDVSAIDGFAGFAEHLIRQIEPRLVQRFRAANPTTHSVLNGHEQVSAALSLASRHSRSRR